MAEDNAAASKAKIERAEVNNEDNEVDISRYFNDAPPTIFDEIVAPKKPDYFNVQSASVSRVSDYASLSDGTSSVPFFNSDPLRTSVNSLLEPAERVAEHSASNDTHRDAWIPSEHTRKILRSIATTAAGSNHLERENLTMPGLAVHGDMPDPIKNASIHLLGEDENIHRNVLTASDVTQDERGLRNLIQAGCYRAAVNLSGRLLAIYAQGYGKINQPSKHTPHSLQLWYTRLSLLAKLRQLEVLENESRPFGNLDKPDMYFRFYPELYGTRSGSMASFAFRLLLAEIPSYCGKPKQALDNLYRLLATVSQIVANLQMGLHGEGTRTKISESEQQDAMRLWAARKSRILISVVNCAISMKNYVLAIEILEDLCRLPDWSAEQVGILRSAIGRVHLFLGDVSAAERYLVRDGKEERTSSVRELVDSGLMAVAQNAFQEAYGCFQSASAMDPSNVMLINNMAVCLLYTGQLKAAVRLYESLVGRNPIKSLQEPILLNMCTSYELHTTHCKQTKLHLLRQLNRYKGDAADILCLKLAI
ncbi:trafficking protein particle complex subunit 12 [Harpegnathos saltator]|uniref:Tetratricopeptide repeat protein 15 n=1 Tax=Harpegnathos saltator TaxID=610380 RepID=E2BS49_HARSA|nr:trafficking protein particle complex subunit 12 [Harpegnathos saltator]XP_011144176.1 trafficking protein particle complex subunit 12 [Harpegnathos saltator]XP_011144177.1 trafficking protein particle complex subunit 12 [Harpegnathos saltator]XP_025160040.1 trafficking protein particle complex subunit 12 [Harpegnathos saltator]EFN81441.1 Tetratricopeptide repeat protein 15 [Harpegnathos saltator]